MAEIISSSNFDFLVKRARARKTKAHLLMALLNADCLRSQFAGSVFAFKLPGRKVKGLTRQPTPVNALHLKPFKDMSNHLRVLIQKPIAADGSEFVVISQRISRSV